MVPEALRGIEQSLRECARRALTRGRLDASLKLEANKADHSFTANESLLDVLLAQKANIREELDRSRLYVTQGLDLIPGSDPHGRRLDFLTQELNREENTLGAKSVCAETSAASIELKVII